MSFQGDISSFSLGDVFQNLAANQKTGTLRIESSDRECFILFRDGKAVSASDNRNPSIGEWLVEKELITPEGLEEALKRYKRAKKKSLGEILRDLGLLKIEDFNEYLLSLVQETIYEILSLETGTFEFLEGLEEDLPNREPLAAGLAFPAQSLLMEAARRTDDWQNIRRHMPSENEIYVVPQSTRDKLAAQSEDEVLRETAALLDGTLTLKRVIARLPYARFDCCRAIAQLISEKVAKPLDAATLPKLATSKEDPREVLACLKTILEREPSNREILQKVAELSQRVGQRDEASTHWKQLANLFLEESSFREAEHCLARAIELNPKDLVAWQRLRDCVRREGNPTKLADFGLRFAEHFKALGLMEVVREHLELMVQLVPDRLELNLRLAEARFSLGDVRGSSAELLKLGTDLLGSNRDADATRVLMQLVKQEPSNTRGKKLLDDLRSGARDKRRKRRQRLVRALLVSAFAVSVGAFVVYDHLVSHQLFQLVREAYAEASTSPARRGELIERIRALEARHPFCYTTLLEARPLRSALEASAPKAPPPPAAATQGLQAAPIRDPKTGK